MWILIVVLVSYGQYTTLSTQEFGSAKACQNTADLVLKHAVNERLVACVPKE